MVAEMVMISQQQLEEFDRQFLVDNLRNSQHRFGRAFLERFPDLAESLDVGERMSLALTPDNDMARRHVLKWVKKDA